MKKSLILLPLCLAASTLSLPAGAQTPPKPKAQNAPKAPELKAPADHKHDEAGDHAGHDHEDAPPEKPPANESAIDYMWRKSDEAFHDGEYERAIELHKGIVAIDPSEVESYGNAAWLIWSLGRGAEAIALIERGLKANPENWEMWEEAAKHYGLQKQVEKERDAYQRAIQLAPKEANTQMLRRALAHAAEKSGDLALSVATWRQLVKDFPNEVVNKNNLARVEKLLSDQKGKSSSQAALPSGTATLALFSLACALVLPPAFSSRKLL